jgi:hypothetical protein
VGTLTTAAQTNITSVGTLGSLAVSGNASSGTAAADTNTTQLATTAFVIGQANSTAGTIAMDGVQAAGSSALYARADHVHPTDTSRAPLNSPEFTGTPRSVTAAVNTDSTQIATTAYVVGQGYLKSATASSTYAPLASPALTGNPTAPTPTAGDNDTSIATTAFVTTAVSGGGGLTLLGTIATTSGSSQPLSGLTLTGYKYLLFSINNVSCTVSLNSIQIGGVTITSSFTNAGLCVGMAQVDLATGLIFGFGDDVIPDPLVFRGGLTGYSTSTTTVTVSMTAGNFDAGSIAVYGVK